MMDIPAVELVLDAKAQLGEGALWSARARLLYWIDIDPGLVHLYDPATGKNRTLELGQPIGTIVPRAKGGAMVALRDGFASLDLESGKLTFLADPEKDLKGNRFNDGKCDPAGRFWAGTLGKVPGALYRMDRDLSVHRMFGDVKCSNGIAWSLDRKTMYYIDTPTGYVEAWDYDDATGAIAKRRVCIRIPKENGSPDGCTLDADGNLWVAHWGGSNVTCYDPRTGKALHQIRVPASLVTSVAFGGPDLDILYITTARVGLSDEELKKQPLAGGLFKCKPGVKGIPAPEFGG
ncbi:MAG: SMP-30/gluconolactonase/LRE family protein [Candidatus Coatesbacteria bacterium]